MATQADHVQKKAILSGFGWSYGERLFSQVTSFVVSVILARLLGPEAYGTLAIANIFITILNAVTLTGFGSALIQKKDASEVDFSSTFFFSLGVSAAAYGLLFLCAPLIADFFSNVELTSIIRATGLILIFGSMNTVQRAYVIRKMNFRLFFISAIWKCSLSAALGISMAYLGFGVWALVAQTLSASILDLIVLLVISPWRPRRLFSADSIRQVYGFGWKIIVSALVDSIYSQLRSLVIGKKYTEADLAYYDKGLHMPNLLVANIDSTIGSVLMPALSRKQDDLSAVKEMVRRAMKTSSVVLFPLLIGMMVCAEPIILLLLTETWAPCVPYMQLLSLALMMKPLLTANLQGILAIGKSDVYLKVQVAQKAVGVAIIMLTVICFSSPVAIAAGEIVSYLLFACINAFTNRKYLAYSIREQVCDILPQFLLAAVMGTVVYPISLLELSPWAILPMQVVSGAAVYIGSAWVLKLESFMYLLNMLRTFLEKKRGRGTEE